MTPFVRRVSRLPFRIRVVDEDDLIEVDKRVHKGDIALDFANFEVKLLGKFGSLGRAVNLLFEFVEFRELFVEIGGVVEIGKTIGEIARISNLLFRLLKGRFVVALEKPLGFELLHPLWGNFRRR